MGWAPGDLTRRVSERQQPHPPEPEQGQRIEVALIVAEPPVQTRPGAAGVPGGENAERRARPNPLTGADGDGHRLVRSPQAIGVSDTDHTPPSDPSGEVHHAIPRRAHDRAHLGSEIDTAVPRQPWSRRWPEGPEDPRWAIQRPPESPGCRPRRRQRVIGARGHRSGR